MKLLFFLCSFFVLNFLTCTHSMPKMKILKESKHSKTLSNSKHLNHVKNNSILSMDMYDRLNETFSFTLVFCCGGIWLGVPAEKIIVFGLTYILYSEYVYFSIKNKIYVQGKY
jgi:hypothetical protein